MMGKKRRKRLVVENLTHRFDELREEMLHLKEGQSKYFFIKKYNREQVTANFLAVGLSWRFAPTQY